MTEGDDMYRGKDESDKVEALIEKVGGDRKRCTKLVEFADVNDKARCSVCVYRRSIPNNMHIQCAYDWLKGLEVGQVNMLPLGSATGVGQGLYMFPVLYDPIWMVVKCQAFNSIMDEQMTLDGRQDAIVPLMAVFQLITCYTMKLKSGQEQSGGIEDVEAKRSGTENDGTD